MSKGLRASMRGLLMLTMGVVLCGGLAAAAQLPTIPTSPPKVDLNKAPLVDLAKLPGIGEGTAKKIIAGRPYKSVAELNRVGVPNATIDNLSPLVTVNPERATSIPEPSGQQAPQKPMVWVNTESGIFFREGDRWYGKTKQGTFMTEADALKGGYRETKR